MSANMDQACVFECKIQMFLFISSQICKKVRRFAPRAFMIFFFEVLRNFGRYFWKNRAYGSKVTQHYVIERRLKIGKFSGFVYKTYGKWLLVPKLHFEL